MIPYTLCDFVSLLRLVLTLMVVTLWSCDSSIGPTAGDCYALVTSVLPISKISPAHLWMLGWANWFVRPP